MKSISELVENKFVKKVLKNREREETEKQFSAHELMNNLKGNEKILGIKRPTIKAEDNEIN